MSEETFEVKNILKAAKSEDSDAVDEIVVELTDTAEEAEKPEPKAEEPVEKTDKSEKAKKQKKSNVDNDSVALFSNGGIYQAKWGELTKGYNIVSKEAAKYWLSHTTRVRLATPEEVAKHYGVK